MLLLIVVLRYSIHLWDLNHEGTWESKSTYVYYTDFFMELGLLCLDLMHHIHMLVSFTLLRLIKMKIEAILSDSSDFSDFK